VWFFVGLQVARCEGRGGPVTRSDGIPARATLTGCDTRAFTARPPGPHASCIEWPSGLSLPLLDSR